MPEVSVVIPTRNRWGYLRRALSVVARQRGVTTETIVVDDGSTDETPERLAELAKEGGLRVVRNEGSRGVGRARNLGIAAAQGRWIAFLDDDDLWAPDKLRRQLDAALAADAGFAFSGAILLDGSLRPIRPWHPPSLEELPNLLRSISPVPAGASNALVKAACLREVGGFDDQLHQLADWDLWIRILGVTGAAVCDELLVGYVLHGGNMLLVEVEDVMHELRYLDEKHGWQVSRESGDFNRRLFWRWVASGAFRAGHPLRAARIALRGEWRYHERDSSPSAARGIAIQAIRSGLAGLRARARRTRPDAPDWVGLYRDESTA